MIFQRRWIEGKTIETVHMSEPVQRRNFEPDNKERELLQIDFTDGSILRFNVVEQDDQPGYIVPLYIPRRKR